MTMMMRTRPKISGERILLDIDGVLAATYHYFAKVLRHYHKTDLQYEDLTEYRMGNLAAINPEFTSEFIARKFADETFYLGIDPIPDAAKVANALMQENYVHIVTVRPPNLTEVTLDWLAIHQIPYHNITFIESVESSAMPLTETKKVAKAQELGLTHFIEDAPTHALELVAAGLRGYLLKTPYNQHLIGTPGLTYLEHLGDLLHDHDDESQTRA